MYYTGVVYAPRDVRAAVVVRGPRVIFGVVRCPAGKCPYSLSRGEEEGFAKNVSGGSKNMRARNTARTRARGLGRKDSGPRGDDERSALFQPENDQSLGGWKENGRFRTKRIMLRLRTSTVRKWWWQRRWKYNITITLISFAPRDKWCTTGTSGRWNSCPRGSRDRGGSSGLDPLTLRPCCIYAFMCTNLYLYNAK